MSELIPILAAAGVPVLIGVFLILRCWSVARALVLATIAAIVTTKEERRAACTDIVGKVTRDSGLPAWLNFKAITDREGK